MPAWSLYLVRCADGTLYTGVTTDVERRFEQHERGEGRGAKYLRGRAPLDLVLEHEVGEQGDALRLEARIKKLSRPRKETLIRNSDALDEMLAHADRQPRARPTRR
jgi:putative endonuclease